MAKTANLLESLGRPERLGVALPLHWHAVVLLLAAAATEAEVSVARRVADLPPCDVLLCGEPDVDAALDGGADEVFVVALDPLGAAPVRAPAPALALTREVLAHADHWAGRSRTPLRVVAGGRRLAPARVAADATDRVLVTGDPAEPRLLELLLGALGSGAALVLVPSLERVEPAAVVAQEGVTATIGADVAGVRRLG